MESLDDHNRNTIYCSFCNKAHKLFSGDQGIGCASYLTSKDDDSRIQSYYGSKYDTLVFQVKKYSSVFGTKGNLCDDCMETLITDHQIVEIESGVLW